MRRHVCARDVRRPSQEFLKTADLGSDGERMMPQFKRRLVDFHVAAALATLLCVAAQTSKADTLTNQCSVTFTVAHPDTSGRPGEYVTQLIYTLPASFQFVTSTFKPQDSYTSKAVQRANINNGQL